MPTPETNPTTTILHLQGYVLSVLATMPGGLKGGATISEAVAALRPVVCDSPELSAVIDAAEQFQARVDEFTAAETDRSYANVIEAFYDFRKQEQALCPVKLH